MADYIDRTPMLQFLDETVDEKDLIINMYNADWIYSFLESRPTVDAVEVVRCKDCKHNIMNRCCRLYKTIIDDDKIFKVDNTDFCKWGEKE